MGNTQIIRNDLQKLEDTKVGQYLRLKIARTHSLQAKKQQISNDCVQPYSYCHTVKAKLHDIKISPGVTKDHSKLFFTLMVLDGDYMIELKIFGNVAEKLIKSNLVNWKQKNDHQKQQIKQNILSQYKDQEIKFKVSTNKKGAKTYYNVEDFD